MTHTSYQRTIKTPIGSMIAVANNHALISLDFADDNVMAENSNYPLLLQLEIELNQYFKQKRKHFTIPLSPNGTAFQKAVWEILRTIPYDSTISYSEEAKIFGNPKATRAVANANGKNPISILIL
ncbi:MAG TPA: cysteine methyltransferase [Sulfurimonas sp. UBA10385]|nr:MAG TPA: cysteine methyltransferase [Sulfurimonas sp. UBA10385]